MTTRTIVRAVLRGSLRDIHHVKAVAPGRARGLTAAVYTRAEREFGVIAPPLALHSASPGPLAASWLLLRETLLVQGRVDRAAKEAVATEVSRANSCSYCVDVHQATVETLPPPPPGAPGVDAAAWLRAGPGDRGPAPFTAEEAPEILGWRSPSTTSTAWSVSSSTTRPYPTGPRPVCAAPSCAPSPGPCAPSQAPRGRRRPRPAARRPAPA
ncbi:carboxymuconolactone decarboxylase family protein [Streptomyces sp. I6]|uniref:carboxymuconolactone decarboxylase family protein n=1 Tax=Streptomyces sp. I6 TaxID=2483113 RepID=UPI002880A20C|nr:carboxymuconolactone decarboxylase family protein [Streptomyces sp. I6]